MFKKTLDTFKYMFLDVNAISLSYIFALLALNRFGYSFDAILVFQVATIIIILKILIFALFRVYDIIPKYIGFDEIFTIVLDIGEPVKIYELAENMINLPGLKPHEDIKIDIVGLRPGEKLYEELLINSEFISETQNGKMFKEEKPFEEITFSGDEIPNLEETSKKEIINFLLSKVTSYNPKDFN